MWYILSGVLLIAAVFIYRRKIRPNYLQQRSNSKLIATLQHQDLTPPTKTLKAYLHKDISLTCLQEDGKFYGSMFKQNEPLGLPHGPGCKCSYKTVRFRLSDVFTKQEDFNQIKRMSDIGELNFYQFKYYKYSLMMKHSLNSPQYQDQLELREKLQVSDDFKETVAKALVP